MKMVLRNNALVLILFILHTGGCDSFEKGKTYPGISGAWSCQESSPYSGYRKYLVEIDKVQSQDNLYIISNFHNQGDIEFIYFSLDKDSLFIENQNILGLFINGSGIVNDEFNNLDLHYASDDGNIQLQYFANYSR